MKLYVANRVKDNQVMYGCTVVDKKSRIIFQDCLKVVETDGTSKNAIKCLQWALKRVRSQLDTKAFELDSDTLKVFITNKNLLKWVKTSKAPKEHLIEFHHLDIQLALFPYEIELGVSKEPTRLVQFNTANDPAFKKRGKGQGMTAFLSGLDA